MAVSKTILNTITQKVCTSAQDVLGDTLEKVVLFGSQARGDATEHSDIDIAIVANVAPQEVEKTRREVRKRMGGSELDLEYNTIISLNIVSKSVMDKCATLPFYHNLRKEGIELYAN